MLLSFQTARRGVVGAIGAGVVAGAFLAAAPVAFADPYPDPVPGCSAGDFEQVTAQVAAATSVYFYTHPDVNAFFSTLKGQPKDVVKGEIASYLDGNPQAKSDLAGIRAPLHDMKARCQ